MSRSTAIARGVVIQVLAKFSAVPMSMITVGIATRYLSAEGYGVLATAVVFAGIFEALTELGIGTVVVRRVAGHGGNLERLVGMNLAFSTIYALPLAVLAAGVGAVVYWGDPQQQLAVLVIAGGLVFTTISSCYEPVFDVKVRYSSAASAEFFSRVLTLSAAAAVAYFDRGLLAMCVVQILPQALRLLIQWRGAQRLVQIRWILNGPETWGLVKEALPLTVISIIGVAYWRADGLILSLQGDEAQTGAYYLAIQIAFNLTLISQVFERSVLSTINETYNNDRVRFARAVDQGYKFLLLVGFPIAVIGWPLAGRVAGVVGSPEFRPLAGPPLQFFFVAVALTFLSAIVSDGLIAAHEQKYLTTMSTINLTINVVGNIVLIPILGAVACGIMLIVTETIGVLASQWRLRRHGVHPLPFGYLARLVPAGLLALGAIWLTHDLPLLVPMAAGGIAYVVGAFLVGAVPPSMRSALLGALRPKSLDRMEAEAAADRDGTGDADRPRVPDVAGVGGEPGTEAAPSVPQGGPLAPTARTALDAETVALGPSGAAPSGVPAANGAPTNRRPVPNGVPVPNGRPVPDDRPVPAGRAASAAPLGDITDLPTMELDLASLHTMRLRAHRARVVEMRVIRRR